MVQNDSIGGIGRPDDVKQLCTDEEMGLRTWKGEDLRQNCLRRLRRDWRS